MRDKSEKYLLVKYQFPDKAGKLKQLLETQKRLALEISRTKQTDKVMMLLIAVGEAYDVADDLLNWTKNVLEGVAGDSEALLAGSKLRNSLEFQNSIIEQYLNRDDAYLTSVQEKLNANKK